MTPEAIRRLIIDALAASPGVVACKPTATIYSDRLALAAEDRAGRLWIVHVLTQALS